MGKLATYILVLMAGVVMISTSLGVVRDPVMSLLTANAFILVAIFFQGERK